MVNPKLPKKEIINILEILRMGQQPSNQLIIDTAKTILSILRILQQTKYKYTATVSYNSILTF